MRRGMRNRNGGRRWPWLAGAFLLVSVLGGRLNAFYVDYLWYQSVGYPQVFFTGFLAGLTLLGLGAVAFLAVFLPSTLAALGAARRLVRRIPAREPTQRETPFSPFGVTFGGPG
ncbi:MAG TPA: UPF0182 family protein, partial [Chloroflexota bacterium]|nr:UPF0182 family protein [Chloroflexota bacterium]